MTVMCNGVMMNRLESCASDGGNGSSVMTGCWACWLSLEQRYTTLSADTRYHIKTI
jgi:hypothetical protein